MEEETTKCHLVSGGDSIVEYAREVSKRELDKIISIEKYKEKKKTSLRQRAIKRLCDAADKLGW